MTDASRQDVWNSAQAYDSFIGRWSRKVAPRFLDWIGADNGLRWLDVGCGTGVLSKAIVGQCSPNDLIGVDSSEGFLNQAKEAVSDTRASFKLGNAEALPLGNDCRDIAVSGLVLNFVPDRGKAIDEMRRVVGGKGTVAFYVWDYSGGMELLRAFFNAATALDPGAEKLTEGKSYADCDPQSLRALAVSSGLKKVQVEPIDVPTLFSNFEDYWHPFTLGTGPAPGYYKSLSESDRESLRSRLERSLSYDDDGSIPMKARAWAVQGTA